MVTHAATTTPYTAAATTPAPVPSWLGLAAPQSAYLYPLESFGRELSGLS